MNKEKVLVMGASPKKDRYSNMAANMLLDYHHEIYLLGNHAGKIGNLEIKKEFPGDLKFDTVTLYLNKLNQAPYIDKILKLKPTRVVFNPGTENPEFEAMLESQGIEPIEACTLVMLRTGQW